MKIKTHLSQIIFIQNEWEAKKCYHNKFVNIQEDTKKLCVVYIYTNFV